MALKHQDGILVDGQHRLSAYNYGYRKGPYFLIGVGFVLFITGVSMLIASC